MAVYGVYINNLDLRLPRIALFAMRDIEKGEELTFDYMMTGVSLMLNHSKQIYVAPCVTRDLEVHNSRVFSCRSDTDKSPEAGH